MPSYTTSVGNVELLCLNDGMPIRDPLMPFPDTTIEQWREFPELLNEHDQIRSRYGTTGVRSQGKLIIVDTGLQAPDGTLMSDMQAKGVDPEAVDLVVFTHLHPDHVGWNLTGGKPNFPNARYLVPRKDWDYWTQPDVLAGATHVRDQVVPLEGLGYIDLIDDDYRITDELTTVGTPGHTPGHVSIMIASGGERGYILGDVAHNPAQAHYTDWCPIFDIQPDVSRSTRHSVLDMLENERILVSAGHFPDPGFGHFVRVEGRRSWRGI
ncbi:MAG: MBL fold metallo-hydrolase [Dehalococcoidia bacterium]|nr:MBL fold metallo-hydrolase [Dehalococcoidia bacterium]